MLHKEKKIAFVFPGQGAQYVGMSLDFIEKCPELLHPLTDFDNSNGTNLYDIIASGPEDVLTQTKWTQPAILFHSMTAMNALLKEVDIKPCFTAGHSLGEFTALVANGVLSLKDAMYLVHKRGQFMIKANDGTPYAMSAIIGSDRQTLLSVCEEVSKIHLVVVANYNTPDQTVISGTAEGVKIAGEKLKDLGAKRVIPLPVGGAFHSPLIGKASQWLAEEMNNITFNKTDIPVIANVDAQPYTDPEIIKQNLAEQVTSSVRWTDCIAKLQELGTDLFIEFGPKKVVSGMIKKIDRNLEVMSIDSYNDLLEVIEKIT